MVVDSSLFDWKEIVKFLVNLYDNRAAKEQKKKEEFGIINKS